MTMNSSTLDNFETTSKLTLIQNQSASSNLKRNKILIKTLFALIILLALITGAIIINLIQKYNKSQEKLKLDQQTDSLRAFCSMTRFPDPCLNSVILLDKSTSPGDIFNASLETAVKRVTNLTSLTRALILKSATAESRNESALLKCSSLIDDSLNQLNRSLTASGELPLFISGVDSEMELLVNGKIREMRPWVNDAVNDLWRCFGILGKDNSTAVIELRSGVHEGIMFVSNIYDFLESRAEILEQIHFQLQAMNWSSRDDFEYLSDLLIFGPQYFVLIFLFCLLLRIY